MKILTAKQINKKYAGKYVDVYDGGDTNEKNEGLYEVRKVYTEIHENTTRGEDVGTSLAYTR